jgi:IS5 family transposase
MRPPAPETQRSDDLFRARLSNLLDPKHKLVRLAGLIDWQRFETAFGPLYHESIGRPGKPTRLMVGLTYLKHTFNLADEEVVERWVENPYWQFFCGFDYLQHQLPIDPSLLTRWRERIGPAGMELLLGATVAAAVSAGAVKPSSLAGISQTSYQRLGKRALRMANRYAHARQMRRARREIKRLKTYLGRVARDVSRKLATRPGLAPHFATPLARVQRLLAQQKNDHAKLYSLHAPEVECLSKGKAHKRYEFGVKVSVAATNREGLIVGMQALPGNPYDGHTLGAALTQAERISATKVKRAYVDRGYRGHGLDAARVFISGQRRGLTATIRRELKRRSAIEPGIGHMKSDGRLDRNYLAGADGDAINALLCGAGSNLRLLLNFLAALLRALLHWLTADSLAAPAP